MLTLLLTLAFTGPTLAASPASAAAVAATTYKYAGADGAQKDLGIADVVVAIRANPSGQHYVWQPGWAAWKSWQEVPEIKAAVDAAAEAESARTRPVTPPAAVANDPILSYSSGGAPEQLPASDIARRVTSSPGVQHLAWKPGMAAWLPAKDVPEVAAAMAAMAAPVTPPPAPTAAAPAAAVGMEPMAPVAAETQEEGDDDEDKDKEGCTSCAMNVHVGAELRANLSMLNLGGAIEENPETGIRGEVTRARPYMMVGLGEHVGAMVAVDASQVDDRATSAAGLVADGWALSVPEGYVQLQTGEDLTLSAKVGAQTVAFGVNGYFDDYKNYYASGHSGWASLQQRPQFDILPYYDLGVGVQLAGKDVWAVEAQLLNGGGVGQVEDNYGKNIVGRASLHPIDAVRVWVSGNVQKKEIDDSVLSYAFSGAGEFRHEYFGVLGEVQYGGEGTVDGGYQSFGYQLGLAGHVPMKGSALDEISPVFTFQGYDPTLAGVTGTPEAYDGGYAPAFAVNAYWKAGTGRTALTGLAYEGFIPVNADLPLVHSVVLQTAVKF